MATTKENNTSNFEENLNFPRLYNFGLIYSILRGFEQDLRDFLKAELGQSWEEKIREEMPKTYKNWDRKAKLDKSWGMDSDKDPMNYADFGDYVDIIEQNKDIFVKGKDDFEAIKTKLRDWYNCGRNPIMHARAFGEDKFYLMRHAIKILNNWIKTRREEDALQPANENQKYLEIFAKYTKYEDFTDFNPILEETEAPGDVSYRNLEPIQTQLFTEFIEIEKGLRDIIEFEMIGAFGDNWAVAGLPPNLLKRFSNQDHTKENRIVDFLGWGDYLQIFSMLIFKQTFGQEYSLVMNMLQELRVIRNFVVHNIPQAIDYDLAREKVELFKGLLENLQQKLKEEVLPSDEEKFSFFAFDIDNLQNASDKLQNATANVIDIIEQKILPNEGNYLAYFFASQKYAYLQQSLPPDDKCQWFITQEPDTTLKSEVVKVINQSTLQIEEFTLGSSDADFLALCDFASQAGIDVNVVVVEKSHVPKRFEEFTNKITELFP